MTPHTLSRRSFLAASSAMPLSRSARAQAANANVLLIMTDQQSMSALGANGNPYLKTPAMDSIVADGISFTESYCTYPVCSPARSSVMTGLMPHQTGVMKNGQAIGEGIPNLGEHFRPYPPRIDVPPVRSPPAWCPASRAASSAGYEASPLPPAPTRLPGRPSTLGFRSWRQLRGLALP